MCGIAGLVKVNSTVDFQELKKFTDSLTHRGPDGGGYECINDHVGFGHRRLSVLDLSENGYQPMKFANNRYTITYNGEVYNFIELRNELRALGHSFVTDTDTEVILAAYQQWGRAALLKFNGMFAFAIWDDHNKTLFLARDRFGVKPLYYKFIPGKLFAFASETIAFKYLKSFPRQISRDNFIRCIIDNQLMEGHGYTHFEAINQLLPGHFIQFSFSGGIQQIRWWNTFHHLPQVPLKYEEQVEQYKSLFEDSCRLRMRSDVPIASALSGGVDSSSVYCMVKAIMDSGKGGERIPDNWQKAFVASFPGFSNDERVFAEKVIDFTKGAVEYVTPDFSDLSTEIVNSTLQFDGICITPINVAGIVYKAMRKSGIVVSMDGHGGDEVLYGYTPSVFDIYIQEAIYGNQQYAQQVLDIYVNMFPSEKQGDVKQHALTELKRITGIESKYFKNTFFKVLKNEVRKLVKKEYAISSTSCSNWFPEIELPPLPYLSNAPYDFPFMDRAHLKLASDFHYNPLPANLNNFDHASMQHGVEIRAPLLDYRLVTYSFALPLNSRVGGGYTKRILRDSMKGIMPESIRTRTTKVGLSAPIAEWFSTNLKEFLLDEVRSSSFLQSPYWNGKKIAEFVEHTSKNQLWNRENSIEVWKVLNAHILLNKELKEINSNKAEIPVSIPFYDSYRQCTQCVLDTTAEHITFDEFGVCNYCHAQKSTMLQTISRPQTIRKRELDYALAEIKEKGMGKEYDCIIGVSGGVDSTYLALKAKEWGLRPMVVHFDNGWNTELAVKNIENTVNKLGYKLFTYVIDWEEFKDLQRSFLFSSVVDTEMPTDQLIFATLYRVAKKHGIKSILNGNNVATEGMLPLGWNYNDKTDLINLTGIHKKFGNVKLKNFPRLGLYEKYYYRNIYGIKSYKLLDLIAYTKASAKQVIKEQLDWKDYGYKHYESVFTRFYQGYILPEKFNIDKRKAHFSCLIVTGQMTKAQALEELSEPPYPKEQQQEDLMFVIKKLGFTKNEFDEIMKLPRVPHEVFGTQWDKQYYRWYYVFTRLMNPIVKLFFNS